MSAVYRPSDLAERWACSEQHVRNMIRDGRLSAFRVGSKLIRISEDAVKEFERCQISPSSTTGENSPSSSATTPAGTASRLARLTVIKPGSS